MTDEPGGSKTGGTFIPNIYTNTLPLVMSVTYCPNVLAEKSNTADERPKAHQFSLGTMDIFFLQLT